MKRYSLVFGYRDLVSGKGFVAGVATDGRALLVEEEDGCWVYGVNPGGIAGGGDTWQGAYDEFKRIYKAALYDIAEEAQNFAEFKSLAEEFVRQTNSENEREWVEATHELSSKKDEDLWLKVLKAKKHPLRVTVKEVSRQGPSANELDEQPVAAWA